MEAKARGTVLIPCKVAERVTPLSGGVAEALALDLFLELSFLLQNTSTAKTMPHIIKTPNTAPVIGPASDDDETDAAG